MPRRKNQEWLAQITKEQSAMEETDEVGVTCLCYVTRQLKVVSSHFVPSLQFFVTVVSRGAKKNRLRFITEKLRRSSCSPQGAYPVCRLPPPSSDLAIKRRRR